jgi:predicted PurR-regulated permease PerM
MAGTILLLLSPVMVLFFVRPYWSNLIIAAILAFLLRPVAGLFQNRLHLNKPGSVILTMLILLILLAIPLMLLPALVVSLVSLAESLAESLATFSEELTAFLVEMESIEIGGQVFDFSAITEPILNLLNTSLLDYVRESPEEAMGLLVSVLGSALSGIGGIISFFLTFFFTLTFTLYMLLDLSWLNAGLRFAVPAPITTEFKALLARIIFIWKAYIRGQLGVMLAIGIIVTVAMWLLGIPYALALGFIAGLLELIPTLGPILAAVPAVIVALFQGSTWLDINHLLLAAIVGLVYFLVQQLEDNFLTPHIQGKAVEMPPLVIMLSVMVGIHEYGLLGGIIAVPVVASAREILKYVKERLEQSQPDLVQAEEAPNQTTI